MRKPEENFKILNFHWSILRYFDSMRQTLVLANKLQADERKYVRNFNDVGYDKTFKNPNQTKVNCCQVQFLLFLQT